LPLSQINIATDHFTITITMYLESGTMTDDEKVVIDDGFLLYAQHCLSVVVGPEIPQPARTA
jgi:hypothetical protein